jgi:hypothetical protein
LLSIVWNNLIYISPVSFIIEFIVSSLCTYELRNLMVAVLHSRNL